MARELVSQDFTVVSGLAYGIDTAAHTAAWEAKGRTIAVIGTPLGVYYPKDIAELQKRIATEFLLISQVPVLRYANQAVPHNRLFSGAGASASTIHEARTADGVERAFVRPPCQRS